STLISLFSFTLLRSVYPLFPCFRLCLLLPSSFSFFFPDAAPTEIYTLSLHDALPIFFVLLRLFYVLVLHEFLLLQHSILLIDFEDRKSTRLNSSHVSISYAVFCLKKKKRHRTCSGKTRTGKRRS